MFNISGKGSYAIKVVDKDGNLKYDLGEQPNLTVVGFNRMPSSVSNGSFTVEVGTGTTAPNFNDTALEAPLGASASNLYYNWVTDTIGVAGGVNTLKQSMVFTFALGSIVGNVSELGLVWSNGTTLLTRSRIKDGGGNPTTISVTANDQLIVTYFFTWTFPVVGTPFQVTLDINGTPTAVNITPSLSLVDYTSYPYLHPFVSSQMYTRAGVDVVSVDPQTGQTTSTGDGIPMQTSRVNWSWEQAKGTELDKYVYSVDRNLGLTEGNGSFNQIWWQISGVLGGNDISVLLDFDTTITKLDTEVMDFKMYLAFEAS